MSKFILIKAVKVFIINEKMKSTTRRTCECIKKIVDSHYICNNSTSGSYACKSLSANSTCVINLKVCG